MALTLENEFSVDAPIDQTWNALLELERVVECLPGARLEPEVAGVFPGSMRIKLGPITMQYTGTAQVVGVDHDARTAVFKVEGREDRGGGDVAATIHNALVDGGDGTTRVSVVTELAVTGRPAQFGRSIMQDVAGNMLRDFASNLAAQLAAQRAADEPAIGQETTDPALAYQGSGPGNNSEPIDLAPSLRTALARVGNGRVCAALALVGAACLLRRWRRRT